MTITVTIWRQLNRTDKGRFETYPMKDVSPDMSFLEMLDALNETLILTNQRPIAFDHDCREGICGSCSLYINGVPHGPGQKKTTCELYMRAFTDGQTITVEPFRSRAFPVITDLIVDRSSFDEILQAGGFISVNTGSAPEANTLLIKKSHADYSFNLATCIGCGACVAACKNASAMLFVGAKVSQLALLPQGKIEAKERVKKMVKKMDALGFGNCTNSKSCEAACPKGITTAVITQLNKEYLSAKLF